MPGIDVSHSIPAPGTKKKAFYSMYKAFFMDNKFLASVIRSIGMKKKGKSYPFKPARLVDCGGNLSKRWYVVFYVWNENLNDGSGGLERKRTYDINKYPTEVLRRSAGESLCDNINQMLEDGFCIRMDIPEDQFKSKIDVNKFTLKEALDLHIKNNATTLAKKTLDGYKTLQNTLYPWLEEHGIKDIRLIDFRLEIANAFLNYVKNDKLDRFGNKGVANKTWNNYHTNLNALLNAYVEQEVIKRKKNVVRKIKRKRYQTGKHVPFTYEQLQTIYKYLEKTEQYNLLLFIQFVYYTFTRPGKETRLLKVQDIRESTIFIPADRAKNDKGEHITIPPPLEKIIVENKLRDYPAHYYIFTKEGVPGETPVGEHWYWERHRKMLDELKMTDKQYTLYGYKHTGNIMLYLAGADPIAVQKHNRHASLDQTLKYLRDLGLIRNEDVITKFPSFQEDKKKQGKGKKQESEQPVPALS